MKKYLTLRLIDELPSGNSWTWWTPEGLLGLINFLEKRYPFYEYCDMITNGNGAFYEFVIMKLK